MAQLRLGDVLKKQGISKRRFARMLGIEYNNVFRFFRPAYDPKLSVISRWARLLKVRVRDLIIED
jgi:hypothetical protein